jgi:serine/threonine protein kinase
VESVLNGQPPEASEVSSHIVPRLLNDVAMKCLSKNPDDRFQSMEEMVILLQQNWQTELSRFTS